MSDGVLTVCPSSLDLPNFVVWRCRGAAAEGAPTISGSGLAQAQPGPRFWKSGNLEIQKFGVQKIKNIKILKIQIRSAQNVGKVWIGRKKKSWPYLGPSEAMFSMDRKKSRKLHFFANLLPIFLGSHGMQCILETRSATLVPRSPLAITINDFLELFLTQ